MKKDMCVCKICNDTPSGCYSEGADKEPDSCVYKTGYRQNWQKTTDYEIVRKLENSSLCMQEDDKTPDLPPNCSICEWRCDNSFKDLFKIERKNHVCSAQADWELSEVYNSPECKRLFLARDLQTYAPQEKDNKI
jgi:hypothetical protein